MKIEQYLKYTETHEWVRVEGDKVRVGVTDYAQEHLTEIVFIELPEVGMKVESGKELCSLESVKAVSEFYSPVSGTITEVNEALADSPELINEDPYGHGWIALITVAEPKELEELLSSEDYSKIAQD